MKRVGTILVLAGFAVLTGVLAVQNRSLRDLHQRTVKAATEPRAGVVIPHVVLPDLSGQSVSLGSPAAGVRQVILGFTTTCPYCQQSLPEWDSLFQRARRTAPRTEIVGVSLDPEEETRAYVQEHALPYRVVVLPQRWMQLFRLSLVPSIIVVDSGGTTVAVRRGVLTSSGRDSLVSVLRDPSTFPATPGLSVVEKL